MKAVTDYPVHDLIAARWSPYSFADRSIGDEDLRSLLEAARWAASSYNEQPWRYIIAKREDAHEFERLLSCLVEANQVWAKSASALALGMKVLGYDPQITVQRAWQLSSSVEQALSLDDLFTRSDAVTSAFD